MSAIGVFGGTSIPVHYGHLRTAFELLRALRLDEVRFMPAGTPPHRDQPMARCSLALADGCKAAVRDQPGFTVDDRELHREGPSYSVDTLSDLRAEYPTRPLLLIVGMDAFIGLPKWHHWREILQLAHVVVAHRPGWRTPATGPLGELLVDRGTGTVGELHESVGGHIYIHAVTQLEIASTSVRTLIARGQDPLFLMPEAVREIIFETGCYRDLGKGLKAGDTGEGDKTA